MKFRYFASIALTLALLAAAPVATWAKWRPALPATNQPRVHLANRELKPSSSTSYFFLSPGETMRVGFDGSGGRARIQAMPVLQPGEKIEYLRYTVAFDDGTQRRFKRRTNGNHLTKVKRAATTPWSWTGPTTVAVGRENRHEIEVPRDARTLSIQPNGQDGRQMFVRVVLSDELHPRLPGWARQGDGESGVWTMNLGFALAGGGYDSNAYLAPKGGVEAIGASYWPADLSIDFRAHPTPDFEFSADYDFEGQFYQDEILNQSEHSIRLKEEWTPHRFDQKWRFSLDQRVRLRDETFFGRGQTEEFESAQSGNLVSLADRFDALDYRGGTQLEYRPSSQTTWRVRASWMRADYNEDFSAFPDIYALDNEEWTTGLYFLRKFRGPWSLRASTSLTRQDYDEKFSRDATGAEAPTVATSLNRVRASLAVRRALRFGPQVAAKATMVRSTDQFQDYWSYDRWELELEAGWHWRSGLGLMAEIERGRTSYDNANVDYDPAQPLRKKDPLMVSLEARYRLAIMADAVVRYEYLDREYNSKRFAYSRSSVLVGFELRR